MKNNEIKYNEKLREAKNSIFQIIAESKDQVVNLNPNSSEDIEVMIEGLKMLSERIKEKSNEATEKDISQVEDKDKTSHNKQFIGQREFTNVLNNIRADIAVFDKNHNYLFVNPQAVPDKNTRNQLIGKNDFDYAKWKKTDSMIAKRRYQIFETAVNNKSDEQWIEEHKTDTGLRQYFLRKFHPYFVKSKLKYVIEYGVDITDRIKSEYMLQAMANLQTKFISGNKTSEIFEVMLEALLKITESEHGFVGEIKYERDSQHLILRAIKDIKGNKENMSGSVFSHIEAISDRILISGKPFISNAPEIDFEWKSEKGGEKLPMCNFLGIPIFSNGYIIGIMGIANRPGGYDKKMLKSLTIFNSSCATIMAALTNIKKRQETEDENRNLANIVAYSNDAIVSLDKDDNFLSWNNGAEKIFGYKSGEILGKPYAILVPKEDIQYRDKMKKSILNNKVSQYYEATLIRKNGSRVPVNISWFPLINNNDGELKGSSGIIRDISEIKSSQMAKEKFTEKLEAKVQERTFELQKTQNELKYHVDTINKATLVSVTDLNGNITYVNDLFCEVSGYSNDELIGQNHRILKSNKQPSSLFVGMWAAITRGKIWKGEILNKAKDGSYYWVNTTILPFFNLEGKIEKYVSVRFDITQQKILQEKLKEGLAKEKQLGELKSHFVSTASHQFRTPMTIIQTNSELLEMISEKSSEKAELQKIIDRIKNEIRRMTELMDEVLVLGKITSGNIPYNPEVTDMVEMCKWVVRQFNQMQNDGRKVDFDIKGTPEPLVVDPKLLNHSISNLVNNAFKYSVGSGNPELRLHFKPDTVEVYITDYGIGIPNQEIANLFQPFYRAKNTRDIQGTGLGLCIAKEYTETNNGILKVESVPGKRTTFTIIIPKNKQI